MKQQEEMMISKIDNYIQLFECIQELIENEGKLTLFHRRELESRLDYLSIKTYGAVVTEAFYRRKIKTWEKLLNQISFVIDGLLLSFNGELLFNNKVKKVEINIQKKLTSYSSQTDKLIS